MKTYTDVDTDTIWLEVSSENGDLNLCIVQTGLRTVVDLSPAAALHLAQHILDTYGPKKARAGGHFYLFRQNNSGGSFGPPAAYVFVEASSAEEANDIAERDLDIYFDGVGSGRDCDCCGDSWYRQDTWSEGMSEEEMLRAELNLREHAEQFPSLYKTARATYIHRKGE